MAINDQNNKGVVGPRKVALRWNTGRDGFRFNFRYISVFSAFSAANIEVVNIKNGGKK